MVTQERRIFSCMAIVSKVIFITERSYSLTYAKNRLKYSVILIAPLQFKEQKKELVEWWDGKNLAFKTHSH